MLLSFRDRFHGIFDLHDEQMLPPRDTDDTVSTTKLKVHQKSITPPKRWRVFGFSKGVKFIKFLYLSFKQRTCPLWHLMAKLSTNVAVDKAPKKSKLKKSQWRLSTTKEKQSRAL